MSDLTLEKVTTEKDWHNFVEALAEGHLSLLEVIKINRPKPGDYFGHVQYSRAMLMLLADSRVLRRLHQEISVEVSDKYPDRKNGYDFDGAVDSKDGLRRMRKICNLQDELAGSGPSLLTGTTFEECLQQYLRITGHLEQLWTDSRDLYLRQHYPLATFTAILLLEEMGKVGRIWHDLLNYDKPRLPRTQIFGNVSRSHRQKSFIAVVAGSIVNSRLDRLLGLKAVQQLLRDAESGKLEMLRQACLYVDHVDGVVKTPSERVKQDQAKLLVVLAGEVWAETYCHFTFESDRMLGLVSEFEAQIGYDRHQVNEK